MHVSVLSCEHTCTTAQRYNAFQCFIVTAMKTHDNKADIISYLSTYDIFTTRYITVILYTTL